MADQLPSIVKDIDSQRNFDALNRRLLESEVLSLKSFGAKGNGSTNDHGAAQEALNAVEGKGGGRLTVPSGTYRIDDLLTYGGGPLDLELAPDAVLDFSHLPSGSSNTNNALSFTGSEGSFTNLTSNAELGATVLKVSSTTGYEANDWIRVASNARYQPLEGGYKIGEFARILSVTATEITLNGKLCSGPYKTSDTAKISKISFLQGITIRGGTIIGPGTGHEATAILLDRVWGARVQNVSFKNFDYKNVDLMDCIDASVEGIHVDGGTSASQGFYGVAFANCTQDARVLNCYFRSCRHGVTTDFEAGKLGTPRRMIVANSTFDKQTATAIDSHAAGEDMLIIGNTVLNPLDSGISSRSPKTSIIGNTIRTPGDKGIYLRNQSDRASEYMVVGNKIIGAASYGIHFRNPPEAEFKETTAGEAISAVTITGNEVVECTPTEQIYCFSEASYSLKNINISGNTIRGGGIRLEKAIDCQVSNNHITRVGVESAAAIHLLTTTDVSVTGNTISYDSLTSTTAIRIRSSSTRAFTMTNRVKNASTGVGLDNTTSDCCVQHNDLQTCTTAVSPGTGTGHTISDNLE